MPYPSSSYFNPSIPYRQTWSLVPQVTTLTLSGHQTKSLFSSFSPAIWLFYLLMISAISIDLFLAIGILSKQGVKTGLIILSVVGDLFLAILPFVLENYIFKSLNHTNIENKIFLKELESKSRKINETDEEFKNRNERIIEGDLKKLKLDKFLSTLVRFLTAITIFAIAYWKIYTFKNVIPPGFSIFSLVNGKIIIIGSVLCAVFHLIGSEKAFAHLMFSLTNSGEFNKFLKTSDGKKPSYSSKEIEYIGDFIEAESGNTRIVKRDDKVFLEFIHIIRDDEISSLITSQTDMAAKMAVAIKCKDNQIIS